MGRITSSLDPTEIVGIKRSSNKKAYYAQTRDGRSRQLRSVTAALGVISKDEALMRWAINLYSKCLREIAPTGQVLTADALEAMIEQGANEFERVRYDAAAVGTRAHNLISDWLLCRNMPPLEAEDPGLGWTVFAWKASAGYNSQASGNSARERIWFSPACIEPHTQGSLFA